MENYNNKNNCPGGVCFGDKECTKDLLCSEKYMASVYNAFYSEAATPEVKKCLEGALLDEHKLGEALFCEMSARGWYPTAKAQDTKVQAEKMKYAQPATV